MKELIEKLLEEVDTDIKEWMLKKPHENFYSNWECIQNPFQAILDWQAMRDRKRDNYPIKVNVD